MSISYISDREGLGESKLNKLTPHPGPNQLESLTINSRNDLGRDTFRALATHVNSLKRLDLQDLQPSALNSLDLIGPCPHLWFLTLEAEPTAQHSRWTRFKDTAAWVNSCSSLTDLKLRVADNADFFAAASPTTSLLSLKLRLDDDPEGPQFWTTLAQQTALRILEIRFNRDDDDDEFITLARHALMVEALSDLSNLRHLILDEPMTEADFAVAKCDDLEIVYLHAVRMDDSYLQTIASLPRLKRLVFSSPTTFTYDQLVEFVVLLREQPGADHKGFYLGLDQYVLFLFFRPKSLFTPLMSAPMLNVKLIYCLAVKCGNTNSQLERLLTSAGSCGMHLRGHLMLSSKVIPTNYTSRIFQISSNWAMKNATRTSKAMSARNMVR